jgi:predicted Zn-dependent protease
MRKSHRLLSVIVAALAISSTGCETNPYTGRSQLLTTSLEQEMQMGAQAYQAQVVKDPKVVKSQNPAEVDPVRRVAKRIIEVARKSKYAEIANQFQWEVVIIKDDHTLNAFALPGGKIAVYTGLFPVARNEAGLAAVMGHEVVHALARHGGERMSQAQATNATLQLVNIALTGTTNSAAAQLAMAALGMGAKVGVLLPFSRKHESEADYIGMLLAAEAGYDPQESVRVWQRMEQMSSGSTSEFLSTHPSHGTRIKDLQAAMPEALTLYGQSAKVGGGTELPRVGK